MVILAIMELRQQQDISDVEFIDYLAGYSNNNCAAPADYDRSPVGFALPSPPDPRLHQPWSSTAHQVYNHHHQQQQPLSTPVCVSPQQTPSPTTMPRNDNDPSPKAKRRRSSRLSSTSSSPSPAASSAAAMVERWEPGEIVDGGEARVSSTDSSSSTPPPMIPASPRSVKGVYIVPSPPAPSSSSSCHTPKKRGPRPKVLTPQEKRQKRMDANDRERERMGKLNVAFDSLRHVLPRHGNDRELSKFETIQIAKNYIRALNDMLDEADAGYGAGGGRAAGFGTGGDYFV